MAKVQDFPHEILGSFIATLGAKVESHYHAGPERKEKSSKLTDRSHVITVSTFSCLKPKLGLFIAFKVSGAALIPSWELISTTRLQVKCRR